MSRSNRTNVIVPAGWSGSGSAAAQAPEQVNETPEETRARLSAACRDEMAATGLSNGRAAREIDVSPTVLSKWLRGLYEGDVPAVNAKVARWLETRAEARRRDLAPAGLDRHVDLGVTEDVMAALAHAQAAGDVVLIHGRSGAGKSWAATHYCRQRSAAWRMVATGAIGSVAGLLNRLARTVDAGDGHVSALAAESAVIDRLEGRGALLCVDEAHHLSPRLLDELRCLRDLAGCGLALIGGDELWTTLTRSGRSDQIIGRIGIRLPLGRASDDDVAALARAVLDRAPSAGERKLLVRAATGAGGLHSLRRLLMRAWVVARAEGRDQITSGDLAAAAEAGAPC